MRFIGKILKYTVIFNVLAVASGLIVKQLVQNEGDESTDEFTLATVMLGSYFASSASALRSASVITYMGGAELDLSNAGLADGARLTMLTVMGGVDVRVPPHWRVEVASNIVFGDCATDLEGQDDLPGTAPTLQIDARTIMGGLSITNKPRRTTAPTP